LLSTFTASTTYRSVPVFASTSPNRTLLCTLSSSHWKTRITIHTLPKQKIPEHYCIALSSIILLDVLILRIVAPNLASKLAIATLSRRSTADIIHDILSQKLSLSELTNVVFHSIHMFQSFKPSLPYAGTWDMVGVAVEIYRQVFCFQVKKSKLTKVLK
jgi:hypothetical protein